MELVMRKNGSYYVEPPICTKFVAKIIQCVPEAIKLTIEENEFPQSFPLWIKQEITKDGPVTTYSSEETESPEGDTFPDIDEPILENFPILSDELVHKFFLKIEPFED